MTSNLSPETQSCLQKKKKPPGNLFRDFPPSSQHPLPLFNRFYGKSNIKNKNYEKQNLV